MNTLKKLWERFLTMVRGKKAVPAPLPAPIPVPPVVVTITPTFVETFANLDNWIVSTWSAPGANATHKGTFSASNATIVNGMLRLKLSQSQNGTMFSSVGGEIASKQNFGYGTYDFVVRASSTAATPTDTGKPVSGSITGCFNYLTGSATEIDVEVEGGVRNALTQCTSWINENQPNQTLQVSPAPGAGTPDSTFFTYRFVWSPGKIVFSRNGTVIATFSNVVPSQPAPFLFNHWGTNDANWGGTATPGIDRYMWIKSFSFTPL